jgi:hypothetical protein
MDSGTDVGGTTHDLERLVCSDIHTADTEFVGIRMFLAFEHRPDHDPPGPSAEIIDFVHLEASHRETVSQGVDGIIHLDQLL